MRMTIFKYKTMKGPLHRVPALLKLFFLLLLSIFCLSLPPLWLAAGIGAAIIAAFLCRFTIAEQLTDLKPALYYTVLMYALSFFSNLYELWCQKIFLIPNSYFLISTLLPQQDFLRLSLRLTLTIQLSAFIFRTTSSIEIRDGLCRINKRAGESISLFISFIPQIFENWSIINKAWKSRGGKSGLAKIKTTVFVLISLSLEKASIKAKALEARRNKGI